jgi:sporulation protein YlmC with PRC-barrel domain
MAELNRDVYGIYKKVYPSGVTMMGANSLIGEEVYNQKEEHLGTIKEFMIDMNSGKIAYAIMSMAGIFSSNRLFAVPLNCLKHDYSKRKFLLNIEADRLNAAPSFEQDNWPDLASETTISEITAAYGRESWAEGM